MYNLTFILKRINDETVHELTVNEIVNGNDDFQGTVYVHGECSVILDVILFYLRRIISFCTLVRTFIFCPTVRD